MPKVSSYTTLNLIGSLLPIVAFVTVGVIAFVNILTLLEDENWVTHTYTVIDKSDYLMKTLVDAETGQRGYLISGQDVFLEPYNLALSKINGQVSELRQLTSDNQVQQSNIDTLESLITERLSLLDKNIQIRKNSDTSSFIQQFDANQGKKTMDSIRAVIDSMKNEEQQLLVKRTVTSQSTAQITEYVVIFGTIGAVVITIISTLVINKKLVERQRLEKTNIELKAESEKLREMDIAKEEFSSMVTHELKTPLTPIKGRCEMLLEPGVLGHLTDLQKESVQIIHNSSVKLERLIGDVLDAQKLDMDRMKFNSDLINVKDFMDSFQKDSSYLMKDKNIDFVNNTTTTSVIQSDSGRLTQVLSNLVKNAVDFVSLENGKIEISAHDKDNDIVFYVKDNGPGIPRVQHGNLFKKFFQVDTSFRRKHGGTGLGLVICKGIVEALGGRIWLESEEGKGAIFYFTIPRVNKP